MTAAAPAHDQEPSRAWLRFKKNPGAILGAVLVAGAVLAAVGAPLFATEHRVYPAWSATEHRVYPAWSAGLT